MKQEYESLPFRSNVSMIAFRKTAKDKEFLIASRINWPENFWKFPQGGIEEGENLLEAAKREFFEEIGTDKINILGVSKIENKYDWDNASIEEKKCVWRGQFQRFIIIEFLGEESDIKIDPEELKAYRWVSKEKVLAYTSESGHQLFRHYNGHISAVLKEFEL